LRFLTVAVAATFASLSAALLGPPAHASAGLLGAPAHASARASAGLDYEGQAVTVTNGHRTLNGLLPLRPDACLARFAKRHAERMAEQQRIFHQDLAPIMRRCGLSGVGENVAFGYEDGRVVVNQGWMLSAGHRENILNPDFRLVSVGAVQSRTGRWYTAQVLGRR
jgi:uncharacterized protein YkwD